MGEQNTPNDLQIEVARLRFALAMERALGNRLAAALRAHAASVLWDRFGLEEYAAWQEARTWPELTLPTLDDLSAMRDSLSAWSAEREVGERPSCAPPSVEPLT